jgi:hypothetical protein
MEELESENSDPEPKRRNGHDRKTCNNLPRGSGFLLPSWVRYRIQDFPRLDRFLLGYSFNFLLPYSIFCWVLYGIAIAM